MDPRHIACFALIFFAFIVYCMGKHERTER